MSVAAPVAEDALKAGKLRASTHDAADNLAQTVNPLSRARRPATAEPGPEHVANSELASSIRPDVPSQSSFSRALSSVTGAASAAYSRATGLASGAYSRATGAASAAYSRATGAASAAYSGAKGLASSAWTGAKGAASGATKLAMATPGALGRGFQGVRSGVKSNADDYSKAVNTLAAHTVDPLMDKIGTKKFDPKVDVDSLGWKSRSEGADGKFAISDPHEQKMHEAISDGHDSVKELLHDPNAGLADDHRVDLAKKHLMATHGLKQSGEGGLYDKHVERARAAEGTTGLSQAGQILSESSEGVIRGASNGIAQAASHVGAAVTGVSVANIAKHGAMLNKIGGQAALESDPARQERAKRAATQNEDRHTEMTNQFADTRSKRSAWSGKKDDELSQEEKADRHAAVKGNFQSALKKLSANKELLVANRAAGISSSKAGKDGVLDEYKLKHTNVVDKKTEKVAEGDARSEGADKHFGMPMGQATLTGRFGQGLKAASEGLEFAGKAATGTGAQAYLDKGDHLSAAAISAGGLGTEAAAIAGAATVPLLGGHGMKTMIKGSGYGAMAVGKGGALLGTKLASKQNQHDRYIDVTSGKRSDDSAKHPIDFQGAVDNHDPGGFKGAYEKSRDGIAEAGKKNFRKILGAPTNV